MSTKRQYMRKKPILKHALKENIRKRIKKIRNLLKPLVLRYKSRIIMKKLFSLPGFRKAKKVMFYVSFNNEVNTYSMIKRALKIGKQVYVPITDFKNRKLSISRIRVFPDDLERSKYGILEPKKGKREIFKGNKIDIIIVPGVGFDCEGNRLGYGGGFYDRLLQRVKTVKVGIAFDFQVLRSIPINKNDQKLDIIITEKKTFKSCV